MKNKKHCPCNAFFVLFSVMIHQSFFAKKPTDFGKKNHFFAKEKDKDSLSFFYD
jgi:hypothetical protein